MGVDVLHDDWILPTVHFADLSDCGVRVFISRKCTTERGVHSSSDSESSADNCDGYTEDELKGKILDSALKHVHRHGWSEEAIGAGAEDLGFPSVVHGLFPAGGIELVNYFYTDCNRQLTESLVTENRDVEAGKSEKKAVRVFMKNAVENRLRMILPYIDEWPQAMGLQAMPQNAVQSLANLSRLVDDIWYYAGDRSTDFNWYTKRATLAYVYKSTEIFLVQDNSEDYKDSWIFLDRRLSELQRGGSLVRKASKTCSSLPDLIYGAGALIQNILGRNSMHR